MVSISFWHMQMHPDDPSFAAEKVKSILTNTAVIGLGQWEKDNGQVQRFKAEIAIGDIVAVRNGRTPIALVKVVSDCFTVDPNPKQDNVWFQNRRKVVVLDFYEKQYDFIIAQATGTLTKCKDLSTPTSTVITNWYNQVNARKLIKIMRTTETIALSEIRQKQIIALWTKFKSRNQEKMLATAAEVEVLLSQWQQYKQKIKDKTLTLGEYTNILSHPSAIMPGGYLCNFLERTTKTALGSSKPGTADNFGVKLNNDGHTYSIKSASKSSASLEDAEQYFADHILGLLCSIVDEPDLMKKIPIIESASYSAKQMLRKILVLDHPANFIYVYSDDKLESLYGEFINGDAEGFAQNYSLCQSLKKLLCINETDKGEIYLLSLFLWQYVDTKAIADRDNPNVILYGAPGTGKTHSVVNFLDFVCQGDTNRYEVLQFHPSFSYEDFIEGIKPKGVSKDGNIRFELVNGIFKNFCIKAKNDLDQLYYFVVDEINRANLSAVFGETLSLLEKGYRHDARENRGMLIRTQYSALIEALIQEDRSNADLAYDLVDDTTVRFGVPNNIIFIGMMNDVDKSIDTFDLALRRRFKWIRKDCDYEVIAEIRFKQKEEFSNIDQYIQACKALNNFISTELGLGKSYEFGHSFFMKIQDIAKRITITSQNLSTLFDLYLHPTLKEYLRSVFSEGELDAKLEEALMLFKKPFV